jgi:class 3 adenylate cyclase
MLGRSGIAGGCAGVPELPTGTVTFLFTDLETSTRLWEEQPNDAMRDALARHDVIMHSAVECYDGIVFSTGGDGIAAVFASAPDAIAATLEAQQRMAAEEWGVTGPLRARMGLHSDEGQLRAPGQYVNRPLNRCARLMSVAHGGQVLVSDATAALVRRALPPDANLVDLGEHRLRDLAEPVRVFQLVHPDLPAEFPPLRTLDTLPGNLPRQVTTFVGRATEIASLKDLVRQSSLVTLTGVGGVGKTRLALKVAAELVAEFPDGAWLCESRRFLIPPRCGTRWRHVCGCSSCPAAVSQSRYSSTWKRSGCCCCSTTASISSTRSHAKSARSPSGAYGCRWWQRAAKDSRSPVSESSQYHHSRSRRTTPTSTH